MKQKFFKIIFFRDKYAEGKMRSKYAIINSTVNFVNQLIVIVMAMVVRKYLIKYLGVEILGVNAAIVEVINMLALSEMGIQYSISFRLYKPIAEANEQLVGEIFTLFKKAYRIVGTFILLGGLAFMPFLHIIVNTEIDMKVVYLVYIVQIAITSCSYYVNYYRTLLGAYQNQYFCTSVDIVFNIIIYALKLFVIVITKNYILYLLLQFIQLFGSNAIISQHCKKKLPFIKQTFTVNKRDQQELFRDLKEIVLGNVSGYVYRSTDSMVISAFCGTFLVGLLSNYKTITQSIRQLINIVDSSLNPTWGNFLSQEKDKERIKEIYYMFNMLQFFICAIALIPILCLADDFVAMWIGNRYIIDSWLLRLIVADIYMNTAHEPNAMVMRGYGMFREDKWISAFAAVVNLVFSLVLVQFMEIRGVLIGTLLALCVYWIGRSCVVYKTCFGGCAKVYIEYWLCNIMYACVFVALYIIVRYAGGLIVILNPVMQFVCRGIAIEALLVVMLLIIFGRSSSMKTAYRVIIKPRLKKGRK